MKVSILHRCQLDPVPGVTALWSPCTNGIQIADDLRKVLQLSQKQGPCGDDTQAMVKVGLSDANHASRREASQHEGRGVTSMRACRELPRSSEAQ
jgi:hypothetical protein